MNYVLRTRITSFALYIHFEEEVILIFRFTPHLLCFLLFAQLATSTSSRSSISGLSTKRLTSTLYDIIYYFRMYYETLKNGFEIKEG
jgi:hypothetical protein